MSSTELVEVAVPVPVLGRFHYKVPPHLAGRAQVGARVLVRFAGRKLTGVVVRTGTAAPEGVLPVELTEVLDTEPSLPVELVELCLWIADYYEAPLGEVMRAALPAGSAVNARTVFGLTEAGRVAAGEQGGALPPKQRVMVARLASSDLAVAGASIATRRVIEALITQGLAEMRDQRSSARARLKRERVAQLEGDLEAARTASARSPKRLAVLDVLASGAAISLESLERQVPGAKVAVRELVKVGSVTVVDRELPLDAVEIGADMLVIAPPVLTGEQAHAVAEITAALHGRPSPSAVAAQAAAAAAGAVSGAEPGAGAAGLSATGAAPGAGAAGLSAPGAPTGAGVAAPAGAGVAAPAGAGVAAPTGAGVAAPTAAVVAAPAAGATIGAAADPGTGAAAVADPAPPARRPFTPFLLHGVTGSGKTEVYLRVIADALTAGKTALVLVPEISLTPQLAARFRARFGDLVAILHSGMSDQARLGEWSRLHRGDARIAVGARSAVFAPLTQLGVIVVDEEHDGSFKQEEGVRYHARDVALVRAQRAGAVCVLGSGTPSLESAAHAERGQYKKLVLTERPMARPMPAVEILDLRKYIPDEDAFLSAPLRAAIGETLAAGDQTILFLNRRGFATFVLCRSCGHAFRCPNCAVSLTYHRNTDRMSCHYCGHAQRVPETCPSCNAAGTIERKGLGTEKVAEAVAFGFPTARVARLDRDVASGSKIEAVLSRVARREVDILVGTQMVTKGHDFPGVTLVGVLCADTGLNLPDFRASERTFQLLAQVAGRAGRGDRPGRVMIQTYRPECPAVVAAAAHDFDQFFHAEMAERRELGYPPHGRLIAVRIDGADAGEVARTANQLAELAEAVARRPDTGGEVEIRGPVPAPLERLRGRTRWQIWLRSADRHALRRVARSVLAAEVTPGVRIGLDVDPISAL